MRRHWHLIFAAAALGCSESPEMRYNPAPQLLPQNVQRLALHPVINKAGQYGLEDKLLLDVRDAFLADNRYPLVPEDQADGVVWITIPRYINTPIQFDSTLVPKSYKLDILVDLEFVDKKNSGQALWAERNLEGALTYAAPTVTGGITEEQAREQIYLTLAANIVSRVINGFGTVTGTSRRLIQGEAPSTAPTVPAPEEPITPVNPHPY